MSKEIEIDSLPYSASLSTSERDEIGQKVNLVLARFQHKMIFLGGILNILAGLFVIFILHDKTAPSILFTWFVVLVICDALNMGCAYKDRHVTPDQTVRWHRAKISYHVIIALLCLTYGSVGILYTSHELLYQLFCITFLQLAFVGFSFGTLTDYRACVISNICLLIPYLSFHIYLGVTSYLTLGYDPSINISLCLSLLILAIFLLVTTFYGYKLVRSFFYLSFENVALNQKLENVNKFLEKRVKERTIELENSLELVTYQATHDLLTDLPNQRLLLEYLQKNIDESKNKEFAVASVSLNELNKIKDGFGHQAGDVVIKTIALRLQNGLGKNKKSDYIVTLTRKDVFVIIMNNLSGVNDIEDKAEIIFSIIKSPILFEDQTIKLSASIGVSLFPRDGNNTKSLLMNSDAAMALAEKQGGNALNIYKAEINADVSKQLMVQSYLHDAVLRGEFALLYQPFLDLKTRKICGGEALIRWHSPDLGFVSPMEFIPLAETSGLIIPLGEWVIKTACIQAKKWHDMGYSHLKIAVNLSAKQLVQKNILQKITEIIEETRVDPTCIELELTETEAFKDETIPVLKQLKAMGFSLSIDDFGTGYSGLSNLKLFEIDKLKIDKSFVQDVPVNNDSSAIVSNTIDLAKKLNIKVVAEGIETKEQLDFLVKHGCDIMQGYYFSKPVDVIAFTELLKRSAVLVIK